LHFTALRVLHRSFRLRVLLRSFRVAVYATRLIVFVRCARSDFALPLPHTVRVAFAVLPARCALIACCRRTPRLPALRSFAPNAACGVPIVAATFVTCVRVTCYVRYRTCRLICVVDFAIVIVRMPLGVAATFTPPALIVTLYRYVWRARILRAHVTRYATPYAFALPHAIGAVTVTVHV